MGVIRTRPEILDRQNITHRIIGVAQVLQRVQVRENAGGDLLQPSLPVGRAPGKVDAINRPICIVLAIVLQVTQGKWFSPFP
jgi:hypothetical protein